MITQQKLALLNQFQQGKFDITVNGILDDKERYVYFITVKTDDSFEEELFSKNNLRREFISTDTVFKYLQKFCFNCRNIIVKLENSYKFPFLKKMEFKQTNFDEF